MENEIDYDDFFEEMPTVVLIKRLIDDAIAETKADGTRTDGGDEIETEELDPAEFRAIGTR